jgi:SpoVK/Ycf46/Vps4 family AAA+-type ATPase
MVGSQG